MSSTNLVSPAVMLAGLVGLVALPSSARAQAVTPEQALLNQRPAMAFSGVQVSNAAQPVISDGERALLNRSQTINQPPVASGAPIVAETPVDGVKALLNRSSS